MTMTKTSHVTGHNIQRSDADNDKKITSYNTVRKVMMTMTKKSPVITQSEK